MAAAGPQGAAASRGSAATDAVAPAHAMETADELLTAGQWRLILLRFLRHRMAVAAGIVVLLFYLAATFVEFVAPYDPRVRDTSHISAPPMRLRVWDGEERRLHARPFVYATTLRRDPVTLQRIYVADTSIRLPLRLLVRGDEYRLLGFIPARLHLFGFDGDERGTLLGTDTQGRDLLSRIIYGTRISLTIGFVGVALSFGLGIALGAISGYFGGLADMVIQRIIEVLIAIPSLPLWMALSAAIPFDWPQTRTFFLITVILSLTGWTGMARVVRGKLLSLRDEDFVLAARIDGARGPRVMFRHLIPSFLSHIIASATLAIPGMILGETALSFLGVGLRSPAISWGVLLQEGQNIQAVALMPWLLLPGAFVVVAVLAFNFLGDGLRDAADPYA